MTIDPNHRALLKAVDRLTTQVRRIADTLEPPTDDAPDAGQTTGDDTQPLAVRTITPWLPPCESGRHHAHPTQTCDEAEAFTAQVQDWAQRMAVPDMQHVTATMRENEQLRTERDRVRAELDRINTRPDPTDGNISLTIGEQLAMAAQLEEATATLKRVRALHARVTIQTTGGPKDACDTCESDNMSHPWPCPTTEALAGPATEG